MAVESSLPAFFVQEFDRGIRELASQTESRLLKTVTDRGQITGTSFTTNTLDTSGMTPQDAVRHGPTVFSELPHAARIAYMRDYFEALPIDRADLPKLLADPTYKYQRALVSRANRRKDQVILNAVLGASQAAPGDDGLPGPQVVLPPTQKIVAGGTGITLDKLIYAKKLFRANEYDEESDASHELFIAFNSDALAMVLADPKLTHADYMTGISLRDGKMAGRWLGFHWVPYEALPSPVAGTKSTAVWARDAIEAGWGFMEGRVDPRPDLKNLRQASMGFSFGASRAEEKGVVQIDFVSG